MNRMIDILSLTLEELTNEMSGLGEPKFRAKQIFQWLHRKKASDFSEITVISAQLKCALEKIFCIKSLNIQKTLVSNREDTVKYLYELDDLNRIETVFMSHRHGNSLCISSQVGCRMGCKFCASGLSGLVRNLSPSEMLLQLYETERQGKEIDSIVIMGVGEPLDNFDNVLKLLNLLQSSEGRAMSLRHVSLSTCGLVPQIDELAKLKSGLTLSVSLHGVSDEERGEIMPINRRYGLRSLIDSCIRYFNSTGRRISFEYALIDGENDSENHAAKLAGLLSEMPKGSFHVNLIPINEVEFPAESDSRRGNNRFRKSKSANHFAAVLEKLGINATIRRTMGADINAACGQLRIGSAN
jgi:23S rRNA (adenine2503-C2)-methyltransferase